VVYLYFPRPYHVVDDWPKSVFGQRSIQEAQVIGDDLDGLVSGGPGGGVDLCRFSLTDLRLTQTSRPKLPLSSVQEAIRRIYRLPEDIR